MLRTSLTLLSLAFPLGALGCGGPTAILETKAIHKPRPKPTKPKPTAKPAPTKPPPKKPAEENEDPKPVITGGAPATDQVKPPKAPEPRAAPPPTGVVAGGPSLSFSFSPKKAKAGAKVTLTLSAPVSGVEVFFAGDELTSSSKSGGKVLVVTLPKDASSGYLELRVNGQRFKAKEQLTVE